ncbi:MAG: S1 RNA-binding domain-containing protein, partial [Bacteroidota bacterium]
MAEDQQKNEETTDAVIPDTAEAATPTPETPDAEPAPAEAPAAEAPAPEATAEAPEAEAPTETPEGETTDDEPPATQVEAMLSQKDETLEPATLETDDDEQGGGEPAPGGDGEAVEPDAEVSILEAAFENLAEDIEIPSARQAGVVPDAPPVELTSVVSGTALSQKTATVGYTGEILGKVVKLEDLAAADAEESEVDSSSYNQLRALIETTLTEVSENEIVQGRVVSVGEKDVVIDIGFKSDGVVSKNEFGAELNPGDEVEVYLEYLEDWHGQLVLSKTKADTVQRWQRIEQIFENEEVVEGTIIRRIKGGMIAELFDGVEAFLPGSQIDVRPVRDFDAYLSKRMQFKIVKLNPANENIVVSHKALVEKELQAQRESILSTMEAGQVLEGTVKNITDFGVFIDLGGVDGLLHITDLSWGRVSHPSELVELDEKMNVVVLDYDKERQRISLGLKQLQPHPWDNIADKFSEDDTVEGKVVSITDYGAFVEL